MLERFSRFFSSTGPTPDPSSILVPPNLPSGLEAVTGCSFNGGLYRVHNATTAALAQRFVGDAFPAYATRTACFGFDWLGRQFAVDHAGGVPNDPAVVMFEPGTGEVLEIPVPFSRFHDEELVDFADAALAREFFDAWASMGPDSLPLPFDRCVGYRIPLFLGGRDIQENLEVIDIDVYWTITTQLRSQTKQLPEQSDIGAVDHTPD